MPVRRRLTGVARRDIDPLDVFAWSHTGLDHLLGGDCYATSAEASRAWQRVRRQIWARSHRFQIPGPSRVYDDLRFESMAWLRLEFCCVPPFRLAEGLEVLAADRQALAAFARTRAARSISDYLEVLRGDFDLVEAAMRESAAWPVSSWWRRPYGKFPETPYGSPGAAGAGATGHSGTDTRKHNTDDEEN